MRVSSSQPGGSRSARSSPIQASKMSPQKIRASASPEAASKNRKNAWRVLGVCGPRWMSDATQTTPGSRILFNDRRFLDDDVLDGDVLVKAFVCRLDLFDLVDDIGAFDHLAEYRVAPAAGGGGGEDRKSTRLNSSH